MYSFMLTLATGQKRYLTDHIVNTWSRYTSLTTRPSEVRYLKRMRSAVASVLTKFIAISS